MSLLYLIIYIEVFELYINNLGYDGNDLLMENKY